MTRAMLVAGGRPIELELCQYNSAMFDRFPGQAKHTFLIPNDVLRFGRCESGSLAMKEPPEHLSRLETCMDMFITRPPTGAIVVHWCCSSFTEIGSCTCQQHSKICREKGIRVRDLLEEAAVRTIRYGCKLNWKYSLLDVPVLLPC